METENRLMKYHFLMAGGLSALATHVAEELITDTSVNDPGFTWDNIFTTMVQKVGHNSNPDMLIRCHMMCASRAPATYGKLAERVLEHGLSVYESRMPFNPFCQYSIIGILKAGVLLQTAHQCLVGDRFEELFATFIRDTMLPRCQTPSWSKGEDRGPNTLSLLGEIMREYFRPTDHVAKSALKLRIPQMLTCLNEGGEVLQIAANEILASKDREGPMGPGAELFKSLMFALLDHEHRNAKDLLAMLGTLHPMTEQPT